MEYPDLQEMEYPDVENIKYLGLTNMDYLELPDGSTSYLHLLKDKNTIWDVKNEPRMYEVQILHENNEDFDKKFDDILNMNNVHCNICNLNVPKLYLKQHNNTSIHQNLIKLTDEVLERTKNHLKTNDEPTNASLNVTDTFFCETCSKIIQNNDRNNHLESKFHETQINFEKLLKFFIEAYLRVNEDFQLKAEALKDFIESNESRLLKHTSDMPDQIPKDPSQIKNPCETTVSKDPSDITKDPSQSQNPCETTVSKDPSDIIKNTVIDIFHPDYLRQLLESGRDESHSPEPQNFKIVEKQNLPNLQTSTELSKKDPTIGKDPVPKDTKKTKMLIKSINKAGRKREQQMKNIKAFEEFSSYIQTIQEYSPDPRFQIEAVSTSKVKVTALNGDCVLVPRHHFESNDGKYCRVCQNGHLGKDHEMSEEHISRLMVPVADKNCIREVDDIWSQCIICNLSIKFVDDHIKSTLHQTKLKKCFIDIPKQTEENKPNIPEEEGINILNKEKERYEQEKKVEKRVDSQENFDADNFSSKVVYKLLPVFAKSDPTIEKATESDEKNHNEPLEPNKKDTKVATKTNEVKQIKETIETIVNEDKSLTDEPKYDDEVASDTIIKYCSICRINVSDFESHKTSKSHTKNNDHTKKLKNMVNSNNLKELKDSIDLLICEICEVNVNYLSIDEHVNSQHHKRNFFEFTGFNKIIHIDGVVSQCEPCNKPLHRSIIFDHCKQEKHIKKLKDFINIKNKKPNQIKKESKSTENKPIVQNEDVTKMLYHFRAQDVEFLCKTCHSIIPRDAASVKGHVESKQHVEKYNILLKCNKIFKTSTGSFFCDVCDVQIPMTGEIIHIFGKNHNDNLVLKVKVPKDESKVTKTMAINIPVAGPSSAPNVGTFIEVLNKEKDIKIPLYVKYQYKDLSEKHPICLICEKKVPKSEITNHVLSTSHSINFNLVMINNTINIKGNIYVCECCGRSLPLFGEIEHIFGKLHLNNKRSLRVGLVGKSILTYDHVLNLPQGKRMVKY